MKNDEGFLSPADRQVRPCVLTIAGSDSGGNAGIQADLRAFHAYGLHSCTVLTALTAQNPSGVSAIQPVTADFAAAQLDAVLGTYAIRALKTGMLARADIIEAIADRLAAHPEIARVIDPVMIATSGARLIDETAVEVLCRELLPHAQLITPNLPEAEVLVTGSRLDAGNRIRSADRAGEFARHLYDRFGAAVLVKGGHADNDTAAVDVLFDGHDLLTFSSPWIPHPVSTHGTGCSLAAALAAELALGHSLVEAVRGAKDYVFRAIQGAFWVGRDCGVLGWGRA